MIGVFENSYITIPNFFFQLTSKSPTHFLPKAYSNQNSYHSAFFRLTAFVNNTLTLWLLQCHPTQPGFPPQMAFLPQSGFLPQFARRSSKLAWNVRRYTGRRQMHHLSRGLYEHQRRSQNPRLQARLLPRVSFTMAQAKQSMSHVPKPAFQALTAAAETMERQHR
jgi:hypothetical protein